MGGASNRTSVCQSPQIVHDPMPQVMTDAVVEQTVGRASSRVSGRTCGADCGFHSPGNQRGTRRGDSAFALGLHWGRLAEQIVDRQLRWRLLPQVHEHIVDQTVEPRNAFTSTWSRQWHPLCHRLRRTSQRWFSPGWGAHPRGILDATDEGAKRVRHCFRSASTSTVWSKASQ